MKLFSLFIVLALFMSTTVVAQRVQVGDVAPQFTGTTVDGKMFSLQDTAKDSIVVLYFMGYT